VAAYRHVAIEFGRAVQGLSIQQAGARIGDYMDDGKEDDDSEDDGHHDGRRLDFVWDLQATHSSTTAQQVYAIDARFPGQLPARVVAAYREVSRLWH